MRGPTNGLGALDFASAFAGKFIYYGRDRLDELPQRGGDLVGESIVEFIALLLD